MKKKGNWGEGEKFARAKGDGELEVSRFLTEEVKEEKKREIELKEGVDGWTK